ncbi:lactonase family protein [Streptococcus gallolyticus]|nr:lactonase family protein [Streptococcus gallolyticus]MBY5041109.1 lactonase family protein [Streptococcus gallolyticus]
MTLYFGSYTRRLSAGIQSADFDEKTGKLSNLKLLATEENPTYLAFSKAGNLYSVGAENSLGGIAAFTADFQPLNHVVAEGAPLCYVAVDDERNLVYGANYHKGQILSYKIEEDGSLSLADTVQHLGSGPHTNQIAAHAHFADLTPDKYLVTCDLGTDSIITYDVSEDGKLTQIGHYTSTAGAGPRHIVFHPTVKIAYLICELNATIEVLIYDGVGQFERLQTISTLPDDYTGANNTAAIRISKDGKFVYASNRGHDSIAIYRTLGDATLELVTIQPSLGQIPRDFNLVADDRYLIVVHQDSDNAVVFERNSETGLLTEIPQDFKVPEAVCILEK